MDNEVQLVILRGNSGSGKSTTANALQKKFGYGTLLVSQDMVRREILYTLDGPDPAAGPLLLELVLYGKRHCKIVILEGILNSKWYKPLFDAILKEFGDHIFAYYFDIPFDETLSRHQHKPNAKDFGETEMKRWWNENDLLESIPEISIQKDLSLDEVVDMIYQEVSTSSKATSKND